MGGLLASSGSSRSSISVSTTQGEAPVTLEIVLDQPSHVRLPIEDDEIIDRAATIRLIAGRDVRLLTCDTGQATRGRIAGLTVTKLSGKAGTGDEPPRHNGGDQPRGAGLRAQRKNRRESAAAETADAQGEAQQS
jgi:hypothetical protein